MTTMSQDEINAMLAGVDTAISEVPAEESSAELDELLDGTQETELDDINAAGAVKILEHEDIPMSGMFDANDPQWQLSPEEIDVLGEVGNICMGAGATTLYTLLDRRCEITTPRVSVHTTHQVLKEYATPFVVVAVEYVEGIDGKNLLLLKEKDAAMITDVLMGGDGNVAEPVELNELHMSAISEVMNQMIGASATAMAKVLSVPVNISTPQSVWVNQDEDVSAYLDRSQVIVKVSFDMEIEGLLSSQLLQMIPFDLSRSLVQRVKEVGGVVSAATGAAPGPSVTSAPPASWAAVQQSAPVQAPAAQPAAQPAAEAYAQPSQYPPQGGYQQPAQNPPQGYPPEYAHQYPPQGGYPGYPPQSGYPQQAGFQSAGQPGPGMIDVRPMQYQSFDARPPVSAAPGRGMGLIHDIPLTVSVELGKTKKDISEILEFGLGSVVVLDKIAGDPVEVLVNGKLIARGEVVIIDENYGVRITDILNG